MRLETLKQAVSDKFKIDLDNSSRKRKYVYAKKVFCKLARETGATFKEIAEECGISINTALGRMRYALMNLRKLKEKHQVNLAVQ